ncbi:MAG TPA: TetR/AcrR family transcriptional regulator [Acidimicrobiales bacterium]|nr:TetR/AcrR family transcriptional regulator [Acidimicrobiales bacterium]
MATTDATERAVRLPAPLRRRQLLDTALVAFADRSFHTVSMDEVAEAAGVTKPVLYQHFGSKRALYLELLEDVGARLSQAITEATLAASGPHGRVEAGFRAYFQFVQAQEAAFRLLFGGGARRDREFRQAVREVENGIASTVAAQIDADIDDDHRRLLAHGVVGLAESTCRHWLGSVPRHPSPDVLAKRIGDMAWAGLRGVHRD